VHGAVLRGTVENPVGEHELAVERVERAEPQVTAAAELGDGHVTVVGAVKQSLDRRDLEQLVRLAAGGQLSVAHGLHVERVKQVRVEHCRLSLLTFQAELFGQTAK
jgi:hypothetical protein